MASDTIFIRYAHADETHKDARIQHLTGLQRQDILFAWDDRCIDGGDQWRHEIDAALDTRNLGLLLVSPAFIASDSFAAWDSPAGWRAARGT